MLRRDKPAGGAKPLLTARNLSAAYGSRQVLHGVSLDLPAGELVALIGPNGSGKTTLLHLLAGILPSTGGEVLVGDRPLAKLSRRAIARSICLVPQFAGVGFELTVEQAVTLGRYPWLGPLAPPSSNDHEAVEAALIGLNLSALRTRRLDTLSGGERQRVHLARALAQATQVLLLDEPVASLDLRYQQETYERLRALADERAMGILVADHHLNLVAATCDRVLVLDAGKERANGSPGEIITESMIATVFGARMRVQGGAEETPQCLWDF